MEINEFYIELANLGQYKWHIIENRRGWKTIRSYCRDFCPITSLCFSKTNIFFEQCFFFEAGASIGLNYEDLKIIAVAADGWVWHSSYSSDVREQLLKSLGLSESP